MYDPKSRQLDYAQKQLRGSMVDKISGADKP